MTTVEGIPAEAAVAPWFRVLLVEDSAADAALVRGLLQDAGNVDVTVTDSLAAGRAALVGQGPIDCVLLDLGLPDADGLEALAGIQAEAPEVAVVVLTVRNDEAMGLEAVAAGAQDYLVKGDVSGPVLARSLRYASERKTAVETVARLAAIVECCDEAILVQSLDGTILDWNAGAECVFGYRAEEIKGRPVSMLAPPGPPDEVTALLQRIGRGERVEPFDTVRMHRDGQLVTVSVKISPVRDGRGNIVGASTIAWDITETERAREELAGAHRELSAHAAELERRNRHLMLVNEMSELLGSIESEKEACQIAGGYGAELFPEFAGAILLTNSSGTLLEAAASWGDAITGEPVFAPADCWAVRRGRICGSPGANNLPRCRHVKDAVGSYLCIPLIAQGRSIGVLHLAVPAPAGAISAAFADSVQTVAATFMENLALALANFRLREMLLLQSIRDPLTGLYNRRYMEEALQRELKRAERKQRPLGLLMIDVDHFKNWNDTFGHEAGDALIREVARLLERHTRGEDIAARYGGDEFLLAFPEASAETTWRRAQELLAATHELEVRHNGRILENVTVTIGVAAYPDNGDDPAALIRAADAALYAGKRAGRNTVEPAADLDLTESRQPGRVTATPETFRGPQNGGRRSA